MIPCRSELVAGSQLTIEFRLGTKARVLTLDLDYLGLEFLDSTFQDLASSAAPEFATGVNECGDTGPGREKGSDTEHIAVEQNGGHP